MAETQNSSALRIAVIGMGSIGSTFASQLARVGQHTVTAVARPGSARLRQLLRDGGVTSTLGELTKMEVAEQLDETVAYDLVLVTLLAHQVDAVMPALQRSAAKSVQFMFNNFNPEQLRDLLGAQRCVFGMPFVQASLDADGRLNAKIGAGGQKSKMSSQAAVTIFNQAGLPAVFEPDMLLWLRCHAPLGAAMESVCAAAMQRGGGATWAQSLAIARGMKETFTLIERLGYRLYPAGKATLHASPAPVAASLLWSVSRNRSFRELLATGAGESRALVDAFVSTAAQVQPPISVSKILAMKPGNSA